MILKSSHCSGEYLESHSVLCSSESLSSWHISVTLLVIVFSSIMCWDGQLNKTVTTHIANEWMWTWSEREDGEINKWSIPERNMSITWEHENIAVVDKIPLFGNSLIRIKHSCTKSVNRDSSRIWFDTLLKYLSNESSRESFLLFS